MINLVVPDRTAYFFFVLFRIRVLDKNSFARSLDVLEPGLEVWSGPGQQNAIPSFLVGTVADPTNQNVLKVVVGRATVPA